MPLPLPNHPIEPVKLLGPSLSVPKPSQHRHGPTKIYEKSRSSQCLQAHEKATLDTETTDGPNDSTPDKNSDNEDDEAQVCKQLEQEFSEITWTPTFLTTSNNPESYEGVISSTNCDEWQVAT